MVIDKLDYREDILLANSVAFRFRLTLAKYHLSTRDAVSITVISCA